MGLTIRRSRSVGHHWGVAKTVTSIVSNNFPGRKQSFGLLLTPDSLGLANRATPLAVVSRSGVAQSYLSGYQTVCPKRVSIHTLGYGKGSRDERPAADGTRGGGESLLRKLWTCIGR